MLKAFQMFIETNSLIAEFRKDTFINSILDKSEQSVKDTLKKLVFEGGSIQKTIDENTTLDDLAKSPEAIWSILVLYGVLTCKEYKNNIYEVSIPNKSLQFFLLEKIQTWEKLKAQTSKVVSKSPTKEETSTTLETTEQKSSGPGI